MNELKPWHIVVLVVVIFVLFGYKKLPDATRSLGRSLRILKTEVKTLHEDDADKAAASQQADAAPLAVEAPRTEQAQPRVVGAPRVVEAPRAVVPEASPAIPAAPIAAGAPSSPADSDLR